ncbi:MAG: glucokinase, partial [Gallionella sp.]
MHAASIRVLSGDIGGTKTRLAIFTVQGTQFHLECEQTYASRDYAMFEELLAEFLHNAQIPTRVAFGVAGPVRGRKVLTTNLPWQLDADALQNKFGFDSCALLNDLEATAMGLPALSEEDMLTLHTGTINQSG